MMQSASLVILSTAKDLNRFNSAKRYNPGFGASSHQVRLGTAGAGWLAPHPGDFTFLKGRLAPRSE
jgi:hypothetical protein